MNYSVHQNIAGITQLATPILIDNNVVQAGLFGSVVRGEEKESSHIDMLIKFDNNAKVSLLDVAGLKVYLEDALGRKVDLVQYDAIRPELVEYILPEEVRILG